MASSLSFDFAQAMSQQFQPTHGPKQGEGQGWDPNIYIPKTSTWKAAVALAKKEQPKLLKTSSFLIQATHLVKLKMVEAPGLPGSIPTKRTQHCEPKLDTPSVHSWLRLWASEAESPLAERNIVTQSWTPQVSKVGSGRF